MTEQTDLGRADWIDPLDHRKGIICREMLYFGERELPPIEAPTDFQWRADGELKGVYFQDPHPDRNFAALRERWEVSQAALQFGTNAQ